MRRQLPVYSPLAVRGLVAGFRAAAPWADRTALSRLEHTVRDRWQADAVVLTDSGTSALALAIRHALRGRAGDAIALPAYCCYDVATAALAAAAPVVLYDVDPVTLGPDWDSLATAVRAGAGAVVVAHLFGFAVDLDRATAWCETANVALIEDAAQGIGGMWRDRPLGSFAPLSVLSFGRGKGLTGGGGGALLGRGTGAALARDAAAQCEPPGGGVRTLVAAAAQWMLGRPSLYGFPAALPFLHLGETRFREPHAARALSAAPAAVLLDSLAHVESEATTRRANARALSDGAAAAGLQAVTPLAQGEPGYLRFPVIGGPDPTTRAAVALGVARGYPHALSDLPQLGASCRNADAGFPGASRLAAHLWTAPTHSRLTPQDLRSITEWMGTRA